MIQISNCPDTGLERFITEKDTLFYESTKQVILTCHISHYKDSVILENERIKSYKRHLVATEDTPVNKFTGVQVESFNITESSIDIVDGENVTITAVPNPDVISEYNFFKNLKSIPVVQEDMERSIIQLRDSQGKFNI